MVLQLEIYEVQEAWKNHDPLPAAVLQRHFPLSNIAGYNLAQDKIIYLWDVQRREQTIEAEKVRKKQLAKEAALASRARPAAVWIFIKRGHSI